MSETDKNETKKAACCKRRGLTLTLFGFAILIFDQLSKFYAASFVKEHGFTEVLPFFNLVLVHNYGVSFGMFSEADARFALIGFTIVMVILLGIWMYKETDCKARIALTAVIAGAIGNMIDRIHEGAVIDFLDFHAFGWHYPAFNIADSSIVLGIAYLLFDSLFLSHQKQNLDSEAETHSGENKTDEDTNNNT